MDHGPVGATAPVLRMAGGFLVAAACALGALGAARASAPAPAPAPAVEGEDDAPSCKDCHEDALDAFAAGSHKTLMRSEDLGAPDTCVLCHGPADPKHPESGGQEGVIGFSKMEPDAMAAACARCHTHHPDHVKDWKTSEYREGGLACAECHKIHEESQNVIHMPVADGKRGTLGAAACRACHVLEAEAAPASIHGKVVADPHLDSCEMCHVGGATHLQAIRAAKVPPGAGFAAGNACLLCHAQMPERHRKELRPAARRGPPPPLPAAACTTCHDPHLPAARTVSGRGLAGGAGEDDLREAGAIPAGSAACAKCHAGFVKEMGSTLHGKALSNLADRTCEACHGPGSLHVETGGNRRAIAASSPTDAAAQGAFCLRCHGKTAPAPDHAKEFAASPEAKGGRTCASCHAVHAPLPDLPEGGFRTVAETRTGSPAAGSAACAKCHDAPHPGIERSLHGPLFAKGEGAAAPQGCEGCHGNGGAHAAAAGRTNLIVNPKNLGAKAKDDLCLSCHEGASSPAAWGNHPHGRAAIGCLSCHDPFGPAGTPAKAPQPALCASCHGIQVAQFKLPNHHPVPEGALSCSDCHDMHRPASAALAVPQWTDTCAKCHAAEASPRMYRHEADRTGGCVACHEPHGTTSPRLLRFSRVVDLCLSCHIPPPTHDLGTGSAYASCLACHVEIHGSDAHPQFLR